MSVLGQEIVAARDRNGPVWPKTIFEKVGEFCDTAVATARWLKDVERPLWIFGSGAPGVEAFLRSIRSHLTQARGISPLTAPPCRILCTEVIARTPT